MKNFIGGLFKDRKGAELALKALKENGFENDSINMLECTHETRAVVINNPSGQSIAIAAALGGFLLGTLGALLGLLVGLDVIQIPTLEPSGGATVPFEVTGEFIFSSVLSGLILGAVTGIILGVAARFWLMKYRKVDTHKGVRPGDIMLAVQADDIRRETKARLTMKEYGAVKFEEFRNMWDTDIWSVFDEKKNVPQTS
jgi:hypothetical protein